MTADEYVAERLDDQIAWYDAKSLASQRWFKRLRMAEFVAAASIPFLAAYLAPGLPQTKILIGVVGVGVAVITAALGLYQFQEHWIEYRTTCEALKREKYLFLTSSEPYRGDPADRLQLLVQRVEALISKENASWAQHMMPPKDDAAQGQVRT